MPRLVLSTAWSGGHREVVAGLGKQAAHEHHQNACAATTRNVSSTTTSLIIPSKRNRKSRILYNFTTQSYAARLGPKPLIDYLRAFLTNICSAKTCTPQIHQSQLPPPPESVKVSTCGHPFFSGYRSLEIAIRHTFLVALLTFLARALAAGSHQERIGQDVVYQ
jgi:hypothetical protein